MTVFMKSNLVKTKAEFCDGKDPCVVLVTFDSPDHHKFFEGTILLSEWEELGSHYEDFSKERFEPFVGTVSLVGEVK